MNQYAFRAALVALVFAAPPLAAVAAHDIALAKVAADLGFGYSYLGPEDAVALTRRGVTVVIRPGERLFDVNDRTEAMDGSAPRFSHSDIFVSRALVARLRQIAMLYPAEATGEPPPPYPRPVAAIEVPATGAITDLSVSQVAGQQEIAIRGKAPANLPITLTLVATLSAELPDVVLSRHEVTADATGRFTWTASAAPGFYRGSILTLVASSLSGISPAKSSIVLNAPNGTVPIPADQQPRSIR